MILLLHCLPDEIPVGKLCSQFAYFKWSPHVYLVVGLLLVTKWSQDMAMKTTGSSFPGQSVDMASNEFRRRISSNSLLFGMIGQEPGTRYMPTSELKH